MAQLCYNLLYNESTGKSPFELATMRQPYARSQIAANYKGANPGAHKFAKDMENKEQMTHAVLNKAAKKMKK